MKAPKYLPEGTDKSKKMQSENLQTTKSYRKNYDSIFKNVKKIKGSTL